MKMGVFVDGEPMHGSVPFNAGTNPLEPYGILMIGQNQVDPFRGQPRQREKAFE